MGIGKQAKVLTGHQQKALLAWLATRKHAQRNRLIVLLSFKCGLRAKEIAALKWSMVMNADGQIGEHVHLTNAASKGRSGRIIPICKELMAALTEYAADNRIDIQDADQFVIRTQKQDRTSAATITNAFFDWYRMLGFVGCSSHSGRRTFITNAARKVALVGGSLRDVQSLAGHSSLQTTSRYIETDQEAQSRLVELV